MSDLPTKVEAALKALAETVLLPDRGGANVYKGLDGNVNLPLPRIEVHAAQGPEDEPEMGNYWVDSIIEIYSNANASAAQHEDRAANVIAAFKTDTLAVDLSALVANFTCQAILQRDYQPREKEERHFVTRYAFRSLCCESDL